MIKLMPMFFKFFFILSFLNLSYGDQLKFDHKDETRILFNRFENTLKLYLINRKIANGWEIKSNYETGVIETNWYRDHKGEVRLKTIISINDGLYRVDVWQNCGWFFENPEKTHFSKLMEWSLQRTIEHDVYGR